MGVGAMGVLYLRLIDSCITQLKAQGPCRTCNESKEEEEGRWGRWECCCGGFMDELCWKWSEERVGWQVCTLTGHAGWVRSVAFSPDGKRIVSGSADNLVKIWNVKTGAEVSSFVREHCGGWGDFRKVDVRLPGMGDSNNHGARPVRLIITMIKWIRTSRLSIKNSLSLG